MLLAALSLLLLGDSLADRFAPPAGFIRHEAPADSFATFLRALPLAPAGTPVHLYDGSEKGNQAAHAAVIAYEIGKTDLEQCADGVMHLYAAYLRAQKRDQEICFRFTSGDPAPWPRYRDGDRASIGKRVSWAKRAKKDDSDTVFRQYLELVFTYAGTLSLARDLVQTDARHVEPGDVFVHGGSPGHAVLVADVASAPDGRRAFLLIQGYMPAQQLHVLKNPSRRDAWYVAMEQPELTTPEWTFDWRDAMRFPRTLCP